MGNLQETEADNNKNFIMYLFGTVYILTFLFISYKILTETLIY